MSLVMFGFNINYTIFILLKVMKTSNSDASEFKMRNKDFPALPGTQIQMKNVANTMPTVIDSNKQWNTTNIGSEQLNKLDMDPFIGHNSSRSYLNTDFHMNGRTVPKPGVQISLNDGLLNISFIFFKIN